MEQVDVGVALADQGESVAVTVAEPSDFVGSVAGIADEHEDAIGEPDQEQAEQTTRKLRGRVMATALALVLLG
jgi:hypothetical protein